MRRKNRRPPPNLRPRLRNLLLPTLRRRRDAASDQKHLQVFIESSGWIGAVLLVLSMYFIATVSKLFFAMKLDKELPPETVAEVNALVDQRNFQAVYDLSRPTKPCSAASPLPALPK